MEFVKNGGIDYFVETKLGHNIYLKFLYVVLSDDSEGVKNNIISHNIFKKRDIYHANF